MIDRIQTQLPPDERLSEIYSKYYEKECPIGAFPRRIREVAETIHESQNLPMEFLCFIACGIISGVMGKSFRAYEAVNEYTQNPNLFMLGLGVSSSGKSASLNILSKHLKRLEAKARDDYAKKKSEAKTVCITEEVLEDEKGKEAIELDPTFLVSNTTSEALADLMARNGGSVFYLCPEARTLLAIAGDLYRKDSDDTEIYNSAWSGETLRQERITRNIAEVRFPCLSVLWLVQYDAFRGFMVKKESFRESGFAGRFLFFKGPDKIPFDEGKDRKLNKFVLDEWDALIESIFHHRMNNGFQKIYATAQAREVFRKFNNEQVKLANKELESVQELLGKARENAVRLAIVFAVANDVVEINEYTAKDACDVIKYSIYNSIEFYTVGLVAKIEGQRKNIENLLRLKNGRLAISYFFQSAKIDTKTVRNIVETFPDLYAIKKEGNGTFVYLKEVYPDEVEISKEEIPTNKESSLDFDDLF